MKRKENVRKLTYQQNTAGALAEIQQKLWLMTDAKIDLSDYMKQLLLG
ncbi:MAG: hypothetical protein LBI31_07380 [Zoogloeaceae bacterium]|nr:hypothetical protein [Zoogloeaceae bacterium]